MSPKDVTLIVAAYKSSPEHLCAALVSAAAQTYGNIEVIVSDDSPTDALRDVVEALSDARFRYRHNTPALGVAANHAQCVAEARTEYIVILNHDDTLEPAFVERLLVPLQSDASLSLAFCDHWIIDVTGRRDMQASEAASIHYGRTRLPAGKHQPFFHLLLRQTIPMAMGAMFRRAALADAIPGQAGPAYDLWLTYLLCRGGGGVWFVADRLSSWRSHAGNQTTLGDISLLLGSTGCWTQIALDESARQWRRQARANASQGHCACAKWYFRRRDRDEGRSYLLRAMRQSWSLRAAALYAWSYLPWF
jgi:glycosyltransferase involved in cell wall biosynthesis